jgi:glycosyltransferase involved in cell wall biosynthesis
MTNPSVTIVTPSYNQGRFIRATIESILSQNYPNLEYIVMDGGSTDETSAVVADYASRLKFISEKDRGQSHAINKGFRMAKGDILAWLNSDDLYLPGSVQHAVDAFCAHPAAGAVYGEGYLIDYDGNTSSRFSCTEPFNLWKLVHLSDYILQQTAYFRRAVLDDVGDLDESLHYTMDWDILIRIGMKYQLEYIPEYMGCLREYPAAKSSAGGARRIREIRKLLQRHTGKRLPPGYIVYGLDTWQRFMCATIGKRAPSKLRPITDRLESAIRLGAGLIIGRTIRDSQGMYTDGWASRMLRYMLPPGVGPVIIEGALPDWASLYGQRLHVNANGLLLGAYDLSPGDFELAVKVPDALRGHTLHLTITARLSFVPGRFTMRGDRRRLAYLIKGIRWRGESPDRDQESSQLSRPLGSPKSRPGAYSKLK